MKIRWLFTMMFCLTLSSCRTKSEVRREAELDRVQQAIKEAKGDRADVESMIEEIRAEMTRMGAVVEAEAQARRKESDDLRKELQVVSARMQAVEQRAVAEELTAKQPAPSAHESQRTTYEQGKHLYDEGKFDEASEVLKAVVRVQGKNEEGKRAQLLLGESLFAGKDYASSALEFGEFKKNFPKDSQVPNAILKQAFSFKAMGKRQEARLFFQEVIERYPRSPAAIKAKTEVKKGKY